MVLVVGDDVDALLAHVLEELAGRVPAADVIVEQTHLDPAVRRAGQRIGERPSDAVVAEDVHLERDSVPRRLDGREPGREGLRAVAQQADRVARDELVRVLDGTEVPPGRRGRRHRRWNPGL